MGFRCVLRNGKVKKEDLAEKSQEQDQQAIKSSLRASVESFLEQFRIVRRALVHPQVPWHVKAIATCAVLYIVSPIQLIPNFIPVIGQIDDVVAIIAAVKYLHPNSGFCFLRVQGVGRPPTVAVDRAA